MNIRNAAELAVSMTVIGALLAACGGGGGSGTTATTTSNPVTYTSAAAIGELLDYTVDTTNLTYSYIITDSQYHLGGTKGSGTLTHNADGTYTPSGVNTARVVVLPNGLLLGAFSVTLNGVLTTVPVIGMSNPVTTVSEAAGTYNFVERYDIAGTKTSNYGTFQITSGGTWSNCISGNLTTTCSGVSQSGTLNSLGGGEYQVLHGATVIGTAIIQSSSGQNVVVLDLNNASTGLGLLVGSTQQIATTVHTDGNWYTISTAGVTSTFTTSGLNQNYSTINGVSSVLTDSFTLNSPWPGFAITTAPGANQAKALLAGTGVFAAIENNGTAVIGLKLN